MQPRYSKDGSQFKTSAYDNSAKSIEKANNNYQFSTNLDDLAVTFDVMKNLDDFRIVILNSHGIILKDGQFGIQLGIEEPKDIKEIIANQLDNRITL